MVWIYTSVLIQLLLNVIDNLNVAHPVAPRIQDLHLIVLYQSCSQLLLVEVGAKQTEK